MTTIKERTQTRTMQSLENTGDLKVYIHIITKNFWEYYLEKPNKNGVAFGFVMGFENELGYVNINELKPYTMSVSIGENLTDVMPAIGYKWK